MSNWLARSRVSRWLNERFLGIDRRRMPPAFAPRTLLQRFPRARTYDESDLRGRRVLLFPDTFTNYFRATSRRRRDRVVAPSRLPRHLRPTGLALLRPPAHLQRTARPSRGQCPAQCRASTQMGQPGWNGHHVRAQLHPHDQGRLSRASQGRCDRGPRRSPRRARRSRSFSHRPWSRRQVPRSPGNLAPAKSWCKRTVTSVPWSAPDRCSRYCDTSPKPTFSTWIQAAAAWPARSAMRQSTMRFRGEWARHGSCPRSARPGRTSPWLHLASRAASRLSTSRVGKRFILPS